MSSGRVSEDHKFITFEVNSQAMVGRFTMIRIDGDALNQERILLKFETQSGLAAAMTTSSNSVMIDKSQTAVLAHWFKYAGELMEEWYPELG